MSYVKCKIYVVRQDMASYFLHGMHVFESKIMAERLIENNKEDGPWQLIETGLIGAELICGKCWKPDHKGIDCKERM